MNKDDTVINQTECSQLFKTFLKKLYTSILFSDKLWNKQHWNYPFLYCFCVYITLSFLKGTAIIQSWFCYTDMSVVQSLTSCALEWIFQQMLVSSLRDGLASLRQQQSSTIKHIISSLAHRSARSVGASWPGCIQDRKVLLFNKAIWHPPTYQTVDSICRT